MIGLLQGTRDSGVIILSRAHEDFWCSLENLEVDLEINKRQHLCHVFECVSHCLHDLVLS